MHELALCAAIFSLVAAACSRPTTPSAGAHAAGPGDAGALATTDAVEDARRAERARTACAAPLPVGMPVCRPSSEFVDREDPCAVDVGRDCESRCDVACDACDAACRTSCNACSVACNDSACEQRCASEGGVCRSVCARERGSCSSTRCVAEHRVCREKLVADWLASDCRALCIPYDRCLADAAGGAGATARCDERFRAQAAGKAACNPFACSTLRWAHERKALDPSWKKNGCNEVCATIWSCAKRECERSACNEPIKRYALCAKRSAGAAACDLLEISATLLCEEPPE